MVFSCDNCYFLFDRASDPERCPDCGKQVVRPATTVEILEYQCRLAELDD